MDQNQIGVIKKHYADTDTQKVLAIWKENDRESYTREAFEAIQQILKERGESLPNQDEFIPKKDREAVMLDRKATALVNKTEDPYCLGLANKVVKFDVSGTLKGNDTVGANRLYIGARGMCLIIVSKSNKPRELFVDWTTIREMENNLEPRKFFVVNIGAGVEDLRFKIKIIGGDVSQLSEILEKLPDTAKCGKCPKCAGLIRQGVCETCGVALGTSLRERGFRTMGAGLVMTIIGAFLCFNVARWFTSNKSPIILIWYGPIIGGVVLIFRGLYEVIRRKKL